MKPRRGLRRILWAPIAIGLLLWLCPVAATAKSLSLAWDPNTEEDLAGYKLYIGTSSQTFSQIVDVGHVTAFTVTNLLEGETYFSTVTAYDIYMNESDFSNEVSTTIPVTAPPPPEPEPEPVNSPPGASFTFSCSDLICSFTNTSTDSDGGVVAWSWDFGEGASSIEQSPGHAYASDGTYTVTLVVTDDDGAIDTTSQGVSVTSSSGTEPTPEPTCKKGKSCDNSNREKKSKKWGAIK
jgi:PKD repeat protein